MKTVYKVVGLEEDKRVSIWVGSQYRTPFALEYAEGKKTIAPKGCPIFAFEDFSSAKEWVTLYCKPNTYEIWECKANICKNQINKAVSSSFLCNRYSRTTIKTFAELRKLLKEAAVEPVSGTVFCSSITLKRRMHP